MVVEIIGSGCGCCCFLFFFSCREEMSRTINISNPCLWLVLEKRWRLLLFFLSRMTAVDKEDDGINCLWLRCCFLFFFVIKKMGGGNRMNPEDLAVPFVTHLPKPLWFFPFSKQKSKKAKNPSASHEK